MPPIDLRSSPKITRFRYFGANTTWYLQYHLTCDWLCHSRMTVSSRERQGPRGETVAVCTTERQSLSESHRQRRWLTVVSYTDLPWSRDHLRRPSEERHRFRRRRSRPKPTQR